VAPELIIHSDFGGLFLENPSVMLPLFLSVTLVTVAVVLTFHHYKKRLIPDGTCFDFDNIWENRLS
jgi:predicted membrane protein